jgi:hypothetical protein
MQRLWDLGTLPESRVNLELRRPYHLIARGRAPLSDADVIGLAEMSDSKLYLLLPWLAHRFSLAEVIACVERGERAPSFVAEYNPFEARHKKSGRRASPIFALTGHGRSLFEKKKS